jgi:hypothetical protein
MERAIAQPLTGPRLTHRAATGICRVVGVAAATAVMALAGAGCSRADDSASRIVKAPIRGAAEITGFATTTPEPKDFVKQTRNPNADFMPVGVTPPARSLRAKTPEEIKALEADLDGTLKKHNAAAGRAPSSDKFKSAASAGPKTNASPRGADRFFIPPKPAPAPAPAPANKPKTGNQTNS